MVFAWISMVIQAGDWVETYHNDFSTEKPGGLLADFFVVSGDFEIGEENENRVLVMNGKRPEAFRLLFGERLAGFQRVDAAVKTTGGKRIQPRFGLGLQGAGGFDLLLNPSSAGLELHGKEGMLKSVPIHWKAGEWWHLQFELRPIQDGAMLLGKAWGASSTEPSDWMIQMEVNEIMLPGKASLTGVTYGTGMVIFDDLNIKIKPSQAGNP